MDGQIKRQNQELEFYLYMYLNYQQDNWCKLFLYTKYTYNLKQYLLYKYTPIQIAYGIWLFKFNNICHKTLLWHFVYTFVISAISDLQHLQRSRYPICNIRNVRDIRNTRNIRNGCNIHNTQDICSSCPVRLLT